jgi:hypothetical protein
MFLMLLGSTSCLNQAKTPKIPGVDGPKLNIMDGKIILSVGLENIDLPVGGTIPASLIDKKLKNSHLTVGPRLEGGSLIQIAFDLKDVESDEFRVVPPQTLPNGMDFPFIVGGELPALAFNIPKAFDMTFYASKRAFGFFLPIKLPDDITFGATIALKVNGKHFGVFSVVGNDAQGEGSGLVLMLTLEEIRNNPDVQKLLRISKKKKFRKKLF